MKEKFNLIENLFLKIGKLFSDKKQDGLCLRGEVTFTNAKGEIVFQKKNLVVATGLNLVGKRLIGTSLNAISHMGIGTGTTAASSSDTSLEAQVASRVAFTSLSVAANVITAVAVFPGTSHAGAITEAGIFNASSNGQMLSRLVFSAYNITASDALTVTWNLTASNS